jgi:malate dehydrogenase (oxaloacetate-decarboxylating)(NADP+)
VATLDQQAARVLENVRSLPTPLAQYRYLVGLLDRNVNLFYRVLIDNLDELMPIVYTPTVGLACQEYGHVFQQAQGLFISLEDRGRVVEVLRNWHYDDVRIIVVTDGERILGLGDLGANGMGIPIGKLALYVGCAGVHPAQCLPVTLDTGTNNQKLLDDPLYIGLPHQRVRGEAYDALVEEFIQATQQVYPRAIVQFEDFGNANAFRLLREYRDRICTFDDDIQGTAGVVLAGLYASLRLTGGRLSDQKYLFYGAGEAGIGIGDLIVTAMMEEGLSEAEARQRCWFFDSKGLVVAERTDLVAHKRPYAHEHPFIGDFLAAVAALQPTGLIGVAGAGKAFTQPIVEAMTRLNEKPIVFALSNPTSKSECTAEEAYTWSDGKAIFASGSPFPPMEYKGKRLVPGQGNNSYIFPGVGLGVILSGALRIPDEMFLTSAKALAGLVTEEDLALGRVYPALERIREASAYVAAATAQVAYDRGLATVPQPADLVAVARAAMYEPRYESYVC